MIIAGGMVRKNDRGIIGAAAIDREGELLDFENREARVALAIIEQTWKIILIADQMKFQRRAPAQVGHLSEIECFVTDASRQSRSNGFGGRRMELTVAG
ncbi:hypothetical protein [Hoeflea sp. TYP-13]|uniref:hypothetical protein n=1 Tax=Hoeflea sp. TYP-13 TaxID=3230023 RepID=UPI0034C6ABA8